MIINPFNSKSIFWWNVPAVEKGDPERAADIIAAAGFEAVYIKAAEGPAPFTPSRLPWPLWGENLKPALVAALHARNILVIGWGFLYGKRPAEEAKAGAGQVDKFGLDGYIFDVESHFEALPNRVGAAMQIKETWRNYWQGRQAKPTAFCSWALWKSPTSEARWHYWDVAEVFMSFCDVGMPMVYWPGETASSAVYQLRHSYRQWSSFGKPIIPAGRAYIGDGGKATPAAIEAFAKTAAELGAPGVSWWSLEHAYKQPVVWAALSMTPKMGAATGDQPPAPPAEARRYHVVNPCNIRTGPSTMAADIGDLLSAFGDPDGITVYEVHSVGADRWGKVGPGMWAAICVAGKTYLEAVV